MKTNYNTTDRFIIAEGNDTRRASCEEKNAQTGTRKFSYLRLKDSETARGFLLTDSFVMIQQHKDWPRSISTHTCRDPKHGEDCYSCTKRIKTQERVIVPFWNVDSKEIQIFYATKRDMKAVYAFIDEYQEESTSTPVAISRKGTGKETNYTLMPTRVRAAERELFHVPAGVVIDEGFLLRVLSVPTNDDMKKMLLSVGVN